MRAPLRWRAKRAYAGWGKWGEREGGKAGAGAFPLSHCTEPGRRSRPARTSTAGVLTRLFASERSRAGFRRAHLSLSTEQHRPI